MSGKPILNLTEMPFCMGVNTEPSNPEPIPDVYPFQLGINSEIGRLELVRDTELEKLLESAYALGIEMGTPSDHSELGSPYVQDFLSFLNGNISHKGRALEIGAGVGFLSKTLAAEGWQVESIEPGQGYSRHWKEYGIEVINDFFPSPLAVGPYDLIVFYTVLEHIGDTREFLQQVAEHLAPNGRIALAVPDCSLEMDSGDPSMLIHEHWQYFSPRSLERTLADGGFSSLIRNSSYGRSIYALGHRADNLNGTAASATELETYSQYGEKVRLALGRFREQIDTFLGQGTVGIYCPARALNLLDPAVDLRFFDDAPGLHGKFYPPFNSPIESRQSLVASPPDTLLIMSRTFGSRLRNELVPLLPGCKILTIEDLEN